MNCIEVIILNNQKREELEFDNTKSAIKYLIDNQFVLHTNVMWWDHEDGRQAEIEINGAIHIPYRHEKRFSLAHEKIGNKTFTLFLAKGRINCRHCQKQSFYYWTNDTALLPDNEYIVNLCPECGKIVYIYTQREIQEIK